MTVDVLIGWARRAARIHLVTHARFHETDNLRSAIRCHGEWLTLERLLSDLRFDFHGVALFWPGSGEGAIARGDLADELEGLAWAIMAAGAQAVMASQWSVVDEAGYHFALEFDAAYREGANAAEAWQRAVRVLRDEIDGFSNPVFWAPFALFGDGWGSVVRAGEEAHR